MIMFCDIDAFFASCEVIRNKSLRGKPVVVGGDGGFRGVVASATYEARKFGVHSGMPIYLARKLCPDCIFIEGDFRFYEEISLKFQGILREFSPDVYIASIDEAYLRIDGLERLFGEPLSMGMKVKERVKEELGITITIGIGITKMIAKLAASTVKPDGIIYVKKEETMDFLNRFPIIKIKGFGKENVEKLKNTGIEYLGELLKLDKRIILSLLDKNGINCIEGLFNDDFKIKERKSIGRETTLYTDTADINYLIPILYYLLERAVGELRDENFLATKVSVKVRFSDFKTITRCSRIKPTDISSDIFPVAKELLEGMVDRFVRLIGIRLDGLTKRRPIFVDEKREKLEDAIKDIRKRYGFNVLHPLVVSDMKKIYGEEDGIFRLHTPSCSH
uniref:DNA polymerase IV n=1 Tax=candidate division WOR-3 bacterium TaxID=2052148 RepID=A0A7C4Y5A3_UNCW3